MNSAKPLHQLIYCSRQTIRPEGLDGELEDIIQASVRNNQRAGVTGLLLAHQGWFLQVLEGTAVTVQTTYGRIINDSRHTGSHVISAAPVKDRLFGEWDMCARRLRKEDDAILKVLDLKGPFEPAKLSAATSLRMLMAVRNIRRRVLPNAARAGARHIAKVDQS